MSINVELVRENQIEKVNQIIQKAKEQYEMIKDILPSERTFSNTVHAMDTVYGEAYNDVSFLTFGYLVDVDKEVRDRCTEAKNAFEQFVLECRMDEGLYRCLCEYKDCGYSEEDLDEEEVRLFDKLMLDFQRNGLSLDAEKRSELKKLREKIADLCSKANNNIYDVDVSFEFTREELTGLPDSFFNQVKKSESGKYIVSLQYPELFPVLRKCANPEVRKIMLSAHESKCKDQNMDILIEIFKLRQEAAELMGYDSDASYELSNKMAGDLETASKFLNDLRVKFDPTLSEYYESLLELKKNDCEEKGIEFSGSLDNWDLSYYNDMLKDKEYSVNSEEIRQYFPMSVVTKGIMEVYKDILSLRFEKDENYVGWDSSVEKYMVFDRETDEFHGTFYLDLFPRKGKYSHAACFPIDVRYETNEGEKHYTSSCMIANFSPPTEDSPSLFQFGEVNTFFHEFGHVMHSILSSSKFSRLNWRWDAVEQDFLEVPSMMFENFVLEKEIISRISGHHQTGKPLPEHLRERLDSVKELGYAYRTNRLIFYSLCDLSFHSTHSNSNKQELLDLWNETEKQCIGIEMIPGTTPFTGWNHMTAGYNAGYYGYLWAEVFASDIYSVFKEKGVLDPETGMLLRKTILEPCTILPATQMLQNFLCREPSNTSYLKEHNIE
eukprot:TRINITY_DN4204_c1_g1_i2.p1 TRINITY_DN4204_c1_g1~~TRINITY_DN4204_c1_g1_i2.p1  ORF type:complete len:680 (+),score=151.67 TRINITY_DN4204_c1_g1_i2:51-2042(+)